MGKLKLMTLSLLTLGLSLAIISCSKSDESNDHFPNLNKTTFLLSTTKADTIYSLNKRTFSINGVQMITRKDNTPASDLISLYHKDQNMFSGKEIGTITHNGDQIDTVDIPNLCKISILKSKEKSLKCAYLIQPYEDAESYPYYIKLFVMDTAPTEVTIK